MLMMKICFTCLWCARLWDLDSMEPIGYTPADSNQVRAIAFSSLGSVMCSAVKDSLKIWDLDPSVRILQYMTDLMNMPD